MAKFVLVQFGDEKRGTQGLAALDALQREGSISVRGAALVERDEHGLLLVRKDRGGKLLEGGLGAAVARAPGELLGYLATHLAPRTFAVVAELRGESGSIGNRLHPLGGGTVREWPAPSGDR